MRTPAAYSNNLKNHIITMQMLLDCLYSSNKRAKNWRDKEREYREKFRNNRYYSDTYDNEEKAREKKEEYYWQKEIMLFVLKPVCIHRETLERSHRERFYDYEDEYWEYMDKELFSHMGEFWDKDKRDYVYFGDVIVEDDPIYHYYLFYDVGGDHTFHTPINEEDVCLYDDLEVKDISQINTKGYNIVDLLSNQFVTKVINLILSEDFKYVA